MPGTPLNEIDHVVLMVKTNADGEFVEESNPFPVYSVETIPTHSSKNNPSGSVARDANDNPTQIDIVIGGVTYRQTLTWIDGLLSAWSAWAAV